MVVEKTIKKKLFVLVISCILFAFCVHWFLLVNVQSKWRIWDVTKWAARRKHCWSYEICPYYGVECLGSIITPGWPFSAKIGWSIKQNGADKAPLFAPFRWMQSLPQLAFVAKGGVISHLIALSLTIHMDELLLWLIVFCHDDIDKKISIASTLCELWCRLPTTRNKKRFKANFLETFFIFYTKDSKIIWFLWTSE